MKKVIILFFLFSFCSFGQEKTSFYLGMSNTVSNKKPSGSTFNSSEIFIGKIIQLKEGAVTFDGSYSFSGNIDSFNDQGTRYQLKSHLLGINLSYKLWNRKKRFRPYIGLSIFTEFASNYINGSLDKDFLIPAKPFNKSFTSYSARFYQGTPIATNLYFGFNIHLFSNVFLNTCLGIGYEIIRTKYAYWNKKENVILEDELKERSIDSHNIYSYNLKIGLFYKFSFEKNSKK